MANELKAEETPLRSTCACGLIRLSVSILSLGLQGIVGNLSSGKSALVHRYLTGTYVQEESPEGKNPAAPKSDSQMQRSALTVASFFIS